MTSTPDGHLSGRVIDPATMRRLLLHEATVAVVTGRNLRDLGDSILLYDETEPEPFWNRLEVVRWADDPIDFDRRLAEVLVIFASLGRQPHIWASPLHDEPTDLVARLLANGFRDLGLGNVMALADPGPAREAAERPLPDGVTVERLAGISGSEAEVAAAGIVDVLLEAFDVEGSRRAGVESETRVSLAHPWFTHYLLRLDGLPATVARRATFEGASYLSSIGTAVWARGRGFGALVTQLATADSLALGSEWTYLGVFADNVIAAGVYERSGFERVGEPCPDLLLV
jgi:ribosomal protein S18 acetylase RimI-like enzyme